MSIFDRKLRKDIAAEVRFALQDVLTTLEERWLTAEELRKQFAISEDWMKKYGEALPRETFIVKTLDGKKHKSNWKYPLHKINQMIMNGDMEKLEVMKM
jgi:hypothetical protein